MAYFDVGLVRVRELDVAIDDGRACGFLENVELSNADCHHYLFDEREMETSKGEKPLAGRGRDVLNKQLLRKQVQVTRSTLDLTFFTSNSSERNNLQQ